MEAKSIRQRYWRMAVATVVSTALFSMSVHFDARGQSGRVRQTDYRSGVPIEDRLLPDDEVVVITRQNHGAEFDPKPTAKELVSFLAKTSDAAVVLVVDEVTSELIENRTWIGTRVVGFVNDVLMSDGRWPSQNEKLTIEDISGGELRVGKTIVRAGTPLKLHKNRSYLVFLTADSQGMKTYFAAVPLLIENGRLINPFQTEPNSSTRDPLHQSSFDEVRAQLPIWRRNN